MKDILRRKRIQSALIMCRPNLKGFFYSPVLDGFFNMFLNFVLGRKKTSWIATTNSSLGSSALIVLPFSVLEMKNKSLLEREKEVSKGVLFANQLGAGKIAFAGLLPSLLNHFDNLTYKELIKYKRQIVTGQTMTCIGIGAVFKELSKKTSCRTLSIVGLGTIGKTSLHLLLEKGLRPKKIMLCDLPKRKNKLERLAVEVEKKYSIKIDIALYGEETFFKIYEGDMFLGAVSSRNVLDPHLLKKGSILVDDSFPPIVPVRNSIERMKNKKDVLILSGGRMCLPFCHFTSELWQIPQFLISVFLKQMGKQGLPGCWLEALAYSCPEFERALKQSNGSGWQENILKAWELKDTLDLSLPDFHFFKYQIPSDLINKIYKLRQNA